MTIIDCTDIKAILSPYIDGELDEQTRHLAERHLGECAHCRSLVNQAERLDALVAGEVEAATPAGLSPDFFGAVMARTVYADPPAAGYGRRLATWTGWMAAAAALALAAGIWIDQNMRPSATVSLHDDAQVNRTPAAANELGERVLRDDFYSAGIDLQSRTFEGALPAHAFRVASERQSESASAIDARSGRESAGTFAAMPVDETAMDALMTPRLTLVSAQRDSRLSEPALNAPTIDREHADALYAASILMHLLTGADARSFAEVEHVRRVVEADNLLPRLTEARDRLHPTDRPAVFAAESVLTRVSHGPLDTSDVLSLRDTVATLDLSNELGDITERWDRASSL